jgi:hypothetical protein
VNVRAGAVAPATAIPVVAAPDALAMLKARRAQVLEEIERIDRTIGPKQSDPIYAAIEAYRRERAAADELMKPYSALREGDHSSPQYDAAWKTWNEAWDIQNRALSALGQTVPTTIAGTLAAVAFLQSYLLAIEKDREEGDQLVTVGVVAAAGIDEDEAVRKFSTLFLETIAIGLDKIGSQAA